MRVYEPVVPVRHPETRLVKNGKTRYRGSKTVVASASEEQPDDLGGIAIGTRRFEFDRLFAETNANTDRMVEPFGTQRRNRPVSHLPLDRRPRTVCQLQYVEIAVDNCKIGVGREVRATSSEPPLDAGLHRPKQCSAETSPVELAAPANSERGRRLHWLSEVWVISGQYESTRLGPALRRLRCGWLVGSGKQPIPGVDCVG
jgi:hypothetical protein